MAGESHPITDFLTGHTIGNTFFMSNFSSQDLLNETRYDQEIAQLDPLSLDNFMVHELPKLNNVADSQSILAFAKQLTLPESINILAAKAIVRDIGMIASSLVRHGISLNETQNLELMFTKLSEITQEICPKTIFSACARNCQKERMRTFTGDEQEKIFIRGLYEGIKNMPSCVCNVAELSNTPITSSRFSDLIQQVRVDFHGMIVGMATVKKKVTSTFFTHVLRPYFLPIEINGVTYISESAAQMPILLIDRMLWGEGKQNEQYNSYYHVILPYLPLPYRKLAQNLPTISILQRVNTELQNGHKLDGLQRQIVLDNLNSLEKVFIDLLKFRMPHLKTAEENFRLRSKDSVGSGGYSLEMLEYLIQESKTAREVVVSLQETIKAI